MRKILNVEYLETADDTRAKRTKIWDSGFCSAYI